MIGRCPADVTYILYLTYFKYPYFLSLISPVLA